MAREQGSDGRRRLEHFDVDMGELAEGYQFDGRGRAIQQWRERKEAREFGALVNRLRVRKWQREVHEGGGEKLAKLRQRKREWRTAKVRAREPSPLTVGVCPVCSSTWQVDPTRSGRKRVFCSRKCERKSNYTPRPFYACSICGQQGHNRRTCKEARADA